MCLLVCKGILSLFQCCFCRDRLSSQVTPWLFRNPPERTLVGLFLDHRSCLRGSTRPGAVNTARCLQWALEQGG